MKNILLNDLRMCFRVIALQSEKFSNVHVDFVPSAILCHRIKLFQKYIDIKTIFGLTIIKNLIFSGTLQEKLKWRCPILIW
jgi:hypothetical protein